ncbi:pneumococcal serine-rich repeat protein-like isoform X2 [Anopheles albimanus]|uniref:pneumococcal serine-rich repeat protein-like isoform X2 n=1 Tax=Anopheles albimanus TaxID=7167 RepID=UPI00163F1A44|nr:pneumococcal serine-rich repeat protein-like isoform X2 [Anopheles albimanus]
MSTLTNSASNNNNNNHHHLLHHHQHHQLSSSPQGPTGAAAPSFLATTTSSPSSGSTSINNNHVPAADCNSNLINNNNSSSSSSNHHPPATTATAGAATTAAATPPTPTSSGGGGGGGGYSGVVSGILGVREVSAKLFLPFARTMMPSSHGGGGSSSSSNNTPTDATNGGAGGDGGHPATPAAGSGTPIQQQQQPQQHQHHAQHHNQQQLILPESLNIVLHGYQRKLKTNRKKYFVVYGDTPDKCARLEYFDSEKKFKQSIAAVHASSLAAGGGSAGSSASGAPVAKRSIALRSCFNINKRHDTKKHIIALFTKDDCFCIVFESEDELYRWLRTLLKLQRGEESEGDPPRPTFEHVWDVYVQRKGLGDSYGILGNYRLCITDKILSLVRIGPAMTATGDQRVEVVEFSLASIRRCGASQRYFYLEVGRSSKTGAGEIWMEVQDSIIAQNMHTTIMKSAKNKDDNNLGPMIRIRSSSANAASKPSMLMRRPTHSGQKPINCSPSSEDQSKLRAQSTDAQNSESSSSAASITTVVLAGSPSCTTSRATAPNPNLDPNSEKPLDGPTATAALTCNSTFTSTCTTTSTTTATIITTSTPTTTATTSAATLTAAITTGVHTSSVAPAVSPITIVPLSGPLNAVAAAAGASVVPSSASLFQVGHCSSATGTRHSVAIHSSSSSLASIGSCSPTDGYIPLIPSASIGTGGGGGVGGGTVSGRGVSGSPRLGVTAHSPGPPIAGGGYRRPSFVKQHSQQSQQQQQQRHYQPPSGVASLPPSSSAHHQHPHPSSTTHHHHQHLHHPHHQHHNQQQQQQQKHHHPPVALASQAASTATAVPVLPAASTATHSVAGTGLVQHTPTAASIASCSSSSSSGTSAVTTELLSSSSSSSSSSSTTTTTTTAPDHVTSASSAGVFHQRALSLPSAPMLGHSPHSNTNHLSAIHAGSSGGARSSSQNSVAAYGTGGGGGGTTGTAPSGGGVVVGGGVVTGGSQQVLTNGGRVGGGSHFASTTGIQPVHHRTRSLPLTEESAIRITSIDHHRGAFGAAGGQHLPHHYHTQNVGAGLSSHRKSSSYLLSSLNGAGSCSPPAAGTSFLLSTSPHQLYYQQQQQENGTESPSSFTSSLVPSRSSMESIIEDQRYLPMDLKKPPAASSSSETTDRSLEGPPKGTELGFERDRRRSHVTTSDKREGGELETVLISRLLRSNNLQFTAIPNSPGSPSTAAGGQKVGLKLIHSPSASSASASPSQQQQQQCHHHHHHHQHNQQHQQQHPLHHAESNSGNGGGGGGGVGGGGTSVAGSCSNPSQCSSSSNCNHASSNTHKSTNGSSPAALRRLNGGRAASGTISRSVAIARERCDSLPSRNRTTSETMPHHQQLQHQLQQQHQQQQQHYQQHQQLIQNSGGMPPPRMIPSNRPHSMHISSSHSPPVNSSPLSPPPGGGSATTTGAYSTGSDGSSLSIDESTDSFMTGSLTPDEGNGFSKVINQLNSGGSIPEENSEEFIKDYSHIDMRTGGVGGAGGSSALSHHDDYGVQGALARRGGSPAPPSTVGSVEGSAYMEMCSPSGSSPGDPSGSCYMAMSPVADYSRGLCSSSSAHSRASSLAEDLVDGYVPMTMPRGPQSTSSAAAAATAANQPEEYMNMDPTVNGAGAVGPPCHAALSSRHMNSVIGIGGMSSAASSCSITSGTPSTDLRLSLEKVSAYIAQSGDDCEMNDRPHRTYSVGSRPEHNKRKLRPDILNTSDGFGGNGATNARARAFSVGSRAKVPRSDGVRGYGNAAAAIIVPFLSANESNNNSSSSISNAGSSYTSAGGGSNSLMMMMHLDEAAGGSSGGGLGKKSSSGSLLPDGTKPPGHGSFDRMGDLMEIDYSVPPNRPQANGASSGASSSSTPLKGKPSSSQDALISGGAMPGMEDYLDMTGTNYSNNNNNNNNHGHHHHHHQEVEDDRRAAIVNAHAVAGYVEMHPGRTNSQSTEPEGDYLNMTPGAGAAAGFDVPDAPSGAYGGASTSTALSPKSTSSPIQITHSPKKFSTPVAGPVAGSSGGGGSAGKNNNYLEMYPRAWSNRAAPAAPRIATKVPSSEDYLNMTPLMMSAADSGSEERISDVPPSGGPTGATIASAATTRTAPMVESSSAPDGYMEMWPHNHPNHHNTSAAATATATVPASDDYMNMSCGAASSSSGGEDRLTSAPITIQPTPGKCRLDLSEEPKGDGRGQGGSGLPNYLPLGQNPDSARINATACLQQAQQQQAATTVQAQGTIQTTTGQQSGWVGFSPSKANPLRARCDSRDSGIVTPSGSQATIFPFSPGSPTKPFPGAAGGSATAKEPLEDLSQNYAELSLSKKAAGGGAGGTGPDPSSSSNSSSTNASNRRTSTGNRTAPLAEPEYVNFWPPGGGRTTSNPTTPTDIGTPTPLATARSRSIVDEDVAGDYALMNPAATSSRKPSTSSMGSSTFGGSGIIPTTLANAVTPAASDSGSTTPPALVVKKSIAFLANNQMGFKPIASSQDTDLLRSSATVVAQRPNFGRQLSEWRVISAEPMEATAGGSSSTMAARPNSVNSEMIGASRGASAAGGSSMAGGSSGNVPGGYASGATRPSSANSERLLPIISATSSSASSTSTLCESKNQSPSASCTTIATVAGPRPDSVSSITDPHIISRPPSVSSERELHYASLDLPPCTSKTPGSTAVAVTSPTVQKMDIDDSPLGVGNDSRSSLDSNTSIPSPPSSASLQQQQQQQSVRNSTFSYAQIDFLRTAPLAQKQQQQPQPQSPHPSPSPMNPGADSNDTGASSA